MQKRVDIRVAPTNVASPLNVAGYEICRNVDDKCRKDRHMSQILLTINVATLTINVAKISTADICRNINDKCRTPL